MNSITSWYSKFYFRDFTIIMSRFRDCCEKCFDLGCFNRLDSQTGVEFQVYCDCGMYASIRNDDSVMREGYETETFGDRDFFSRFDDQETL